MRAVKGILGILAILVALGMPCRPAVAAPLTGVQLTTVESSPQLVNTPITLLAYPTGGGDVEYRFLVSDDSGWTELQGYSPSVTCAWTPQTGGDYTLLVTAREVGSPSAQAVHASIPFSIRHPFTGVRLLVTPPAQTVGRAVTMVAVPEGGSRVEYRFYIFEDETYRMIRQYDPSPMCEWTPTAPGTYKLLVWAREIGDPVPWKAFCKIIGYQVQPALSQVTLLAGDSATCALRAPLTLAAVPTGGGQVKYRFFVSINDGPYTSLRNRYGGIDYELAHYFVYTPTTHGKHTFLVWAREDGNTSTQDAYATKTVMVLAPPPLTKVSLAAAPSSPRSAGTAIRLQASPTGGGLVEYRYYASVNGGPYLEVRSYATDPALTYTLPQSGKYSFLVWGREVGTTRAWDAYATLLFTAQ